MDPFSILTPKIVSGYYQILILLWVGEHSSQYIFNLSRAGKKFNFLLLLLLNLPLTIVLYQYSAWWPLGCVGAIFGLVWLKNSLSVAYQDFMPLHLSLWSLFLLIFLAPSYLFFPILSLPTVKNLLLFYIAANIGYLYRQQTKIGIVSNSSNVKLDFKPLLALSLFGGSVSILAAEFLGFFSAPRQQIDDFSFLWERFFLVGIALEMITKVGVYKFLLKIFNVNIIFFKIILTALAAGGFYFLLSRDFNYLVLGIIIGIFTAWLYHISDLKITMAFRLLLAAIPLIAFNLVI